MQIQRIIQNVLINDIKENQKVIILYGPRQTGKTTLSNEIIRQCGFKTLMINADQYHYVDILSSADRGQLKALTEGYTMLFVDEAQRVPNIELNLKILHDERPGLKILVTGSSSFDLAKKVTEPLSGVKKTYTLLPVAQQILLAHYNKFELSGKLNEYLIYGSYPAVVTTVSHAGKQELLEDIGNSYLFKEVIEMTNIKYPNKARDLLRLLAFQIGSQVSVLEMSKALKLNFETVESYIRIFEKTFIIFRLKGFSRNLSKEIVKRDKIYFWDTGIRNFLISNFLGMAFRNDHKQLWENFIIAERLKFLSNNRILANPYFWRTYTGSALDYVEEREGKLMGFEINPGKKKPKAPKTWVDTYDASYHLINKENYLDFIT